VTGDGPIVSKALVLRAGQPVAAGQIDDVLTDGADEPLTRQRHTDRR